MGRAKKSVASSTTKTAKKSKKKKKRKSKKSIKVDAPKKRKKRKSSKINTAEILFDDEDNKKLLDTLKDKRKKSKKTIFEEDELAELEELDEDFDEEVISEGYDSEFVEDLSGEFDSQFKVKKSRRRSKKADDFFEEPDLDNFDLDYDIEEPDSEW